MAGPGEQLEVRILGPLEVASGGSPLALGGRQQRAVLALLATRLGTSTSVDQLVEALWPEAAPPTATVTAPVYVSRLRKLLGAQTITTEARGYRLELPAGQLDASRFEQLAAEGRRNHAEGRHGDAVAAFREALSLWRGPALADFAYEEWAQPEIQRLEERRLSCVEERIDAELALGHGFEVVGELESLVAANPTREHLRAQLMLALYRGGRQADALAAYQQARIALVEQLGVEPSVELQELYRAILNHEESLRVAARKTPWSNLSAPPNELIGRDREVANVVELLRSTHLLTITGPGGCGKTRLAMAAAAEVLAEFPDGVCFVSLAAVRDPGLLEPTVSSAMEANDALANFLHSRKTLLVLDNVEHLLPEAALTIGGLLEAEGVRVLATSRERLALRAEQEYVLPTLGIDDAVALFTARARQLRADFREDSRVVEIVRRLEGLPLAI